jgi:hypothetical protein
MQLKVSPHHQLLTIQQGEEVVHAQILNLVSDIHTNSYTVLCSRDCVCALTTN